MHAILFKEIFMLGKRGVTRGTSLRVPRQRISSQNWYWGPKLPHMQNLGGCFIVFFLGGKNHNFVKVKGLKLQLSLILNNVVKRKENNLVMTQPCNSFGGKFSFKRYFSK